mgnify:CR=1 FL=1
MKIATLMSQIIHFSSGYFHSSSLIPHSFLKHLQHIFARVIHPVLNLINLVHGARIVKNQFVGFCARIFINFYEYVGALVFGKIPGEVARLFECLHPCGGHQGSGKFEGIGSGPLAFGFFEFRIACARWQQPAQSLGLWWWSQ